MALLYNVVRGRRGGRVRINPQGQRTRVTPRKVPLAQKPLYKREKPLWSVRQPSAGGKVRVFPGGRRQTLVRPPAAPRPVTAPKPPAVPAPAAQTPALPPDASFEEQLASYGQSRDQTLAGLSQQRMQGLANYGYNETPGGALTLDPNNPFSKAALLKRTYDQSRRRTGNVMAGGGQLYSGAYQSAQDVVNRGQLEGEDTLQKSLADFLAQNTQSRATTGAAYESNVADARSAMLERLANQQNPLYAPTVGYPSPVKPFPKAPKPPKRKRGRR